VFTFLLITIFIAVVTSAVFNYIYFKPEYRITDAKPDELLKTWLGYKWAFLINGRVVRPKFDNDTVSEGQAYAMLRAVWMNDKETFDSCYVWTEERLSRKDKFGDNLLAWHYGRKENDRQSQVLDWNAAIDADLDYAFALIMADKRWGETHPLGASSYEKKAKLIVEAVMNLAVVELENNELILLPWPVKDSEGVKEFIINPSYFSPGYYALFYEFTSDVRWKKLEMDTYRQIERILSSFDGIKGTALVPDWCMVNKNGKFYISDKHGMRSSWDAFRIWWRIRVGLEVNNNQNAYNLINKRLIPFLKSTMNNKTGAINVEYNYDGSVIKEYESSGILGMYAWCIDGIDSSMSVQIKQKADKFKVNRHRFVFYQNETEYYVNSWAWYADARGGMRFPFGIISKDKADD
jgi:endoglucanase